MRVEDIILNAEIVAWLADGEDMHRTSSELFKITRMLKNCANRAPTRAYSCEIITLRPPDHEIH